VNTSPRSSRAEDLPVVERRLIHEAPSFFQAAFLPSPARIAGTGTTFKIARKFRFFVSTRNSYPRRPVRCFFRGSLRTPPFPSEFLSPPTSTSHNVISYSALSSVAYVGIASFSSPYYLRFFERDSYSYQQYSRIDLPRFLSLFSL